MKTVIKLEKLIETVDKYLNAELARQREIREYWAGMHDTGEGNSFLYARNMSEAQDCIDFLDRLKRGVTCDGCKVLQKAVQLEKDNYLLIQEIKGFPKDGGK